MAGAAKLKMADSPNMPPATKNGIEYVCVASYSAPASGDPTIVAAPLNRISNPNAFVSLSRPSRSTRIIDVSEM